MRKGEAPKDRPAHVYSDHELLGVLSLRGPRSANRTGSISVKRVEDGFAFPLVHVVDPQSSHFDEARLVGEDRGDLGQWAACRGQAKLQIR